MRLLPFAAAALFPLLASAQSGFPFTDESLRYNLSWQSGVSLGEAQFTAHRSAVGWNLDVTAKAGVPGFALADQFHSAVDPGLCSQEFERDLTQAGKRTDDKTNLDQRAGSATRTTLFPVGGGKTDFGIPACARDAAAFVYYARVELGQGRVPAPQQVYFGQAYSVTLAYTGPEDIASGGKSATTDRIHATVKGPKADFVCDIFFARDAARTPLSIRIPLAPGVFSLDLVR
ncbi:MAG: DUF3108 domain-containing protein [Bryobacteraceae bacterium]